MSGVSVAKKNGDQTSAIFANDTRWRPNSQILHRRDRSNSRVTETARPSGVRTPFGRAIMYPESHRLFWRYRFDRTSLTPKSTMPTAPLMYSWRSTTLSLLQKLTSSTANLEWCPVHFSRDSYSTIKFFLHHARSEAMSYLLARGRFALH